MSKRTVKNSPLEQPTVDTPTLDYEVLLPIIQGDQEKVPGTKVSLTDRQAERLRESGHIA